MKNNLLTLLTLGALFAAGCQDNKKETVTTTTEQTPVTAIAKEAVKEGQSVTVNTDEVPDTVRTLFSKKYPKALKTTWMKYEPVASDDMQMDDQYYYVHFDNDGSDYTS